MRKIDYSKKENLFSRLKIDCTPEKNLFSRLKVDCTPEKNLFWGKRRVFLRFTGFCLLGGIIAHVRNERPLYAKFGKNKEIQGNFLYFPKLPQSLPKGFPKLPQKLLQSYYKYFVAA